MATEPARDYIVEAATRLASQAPEFGDAVYAATFTALGYNLDQLKASVSQHAA